jgi:hypothetical protein
MPSLERRYIEMVSSRLESFAQKNNNTYNFRCCYCGDSKKSKTKVRGYLYLIGNTFNYRCHNCGKSISFKNFLKDLDPTLFERYIFEKFKGNERESLKLTPVKPKRIETEKKYLDLPLITELNIEHPARKYLENRGIPKDKFNHLYFTDTFRKWTNSQKPTFRTLKYDEPRIIIPLICNGNIFGFQGRTLSKNSRYKYITIILDNSYPKVYGLDDVDWNKNVYIVEGPFDSMFIPNSIAMAGADLNTLELTKKKEIDFIYIYDNEKRKKEIVERMQNVIDQGHSIVIWPDDLKDKDINDMILNHVPVVDIIQQNTYRGLQAKVKFNGWKRV